MQPSNLMLFCTYNKKQREPFSQLTREQIFGITQGTYQWVLCNDGQARQCKITSVKTWKRSPDRIEIGIKYGLYEHAKWNLAECQERLLRPLIGIND